MNDEPGTGDRQFRRTSFSVGPLGLEFYLYAIQGQRAFRARPWLPSLRTFGARTRSDAMSGPFRARATHQPTQSVVLKSDLRRSLLPSNPPNSSGWIVCSLRDRPRLMYHRLRRRSLHFLGKRRRRQRPDRVAGEERDRNSDQKHMHDNTQRHP